MANAYKSKRYYRLRKFTVTNEQQQSGTWSNETFSSTSDAQTKIAFASQHNAGSPTTTYALEDSDRTLVATFEFSSVEDQTAFKAAIDGAIEDSTALFTPTSPNYVQHFKTEWLYEDGSVSSKADFSFPSDPE